VAKWKVKKKAVVDVKSRSNGLVVAG